MHTGSGAREDSSLGPEEIKEWKTRLQHAHNEWRNAGYIPDLENGTTAKYSMMRYLDAYRGDFPFSLSGGTEEADQMAGNITFSIINTMVSQISARNPDPIVRPIGGAAAKGDARRRAWLNEQVVQFNMVEGKFKREVDMALLSAVLLGFGVVRHGFTPPEEFEDDNGNVIGTFKNHGTELPWIQFLRPWQIRIDPMVNDFAPDSEPRWVAFHNLYFASQIRRNPNLVFRRDLTPTHYQDMRLHEQRDSNKAAPSDDINVMPMYEEWVIYDAETRKYFGISPGCEDLIREEREWDFEWGQLPYSFLSFNRQIDTPFPIPFTQLFYDEQLLYNKIWTVVNALVSRIRRVIFVNGGALEDGQKELLLDPDALVEFILCETDPSNVAKEIGFGTIDGQLIGLLFQLKEQIREVLGVSSFDRGQRANVETAAEVNSIGIGSQVSKSRTQSAFEDFWVSIIRPSHRAFLQSNDSRERVIPIIGRENLNFLDQSDRDNGFKTVSISDLAGEFEYAVKLDSTLRIDPAVELGKLATGFNLMGGIKSKMANQEFYHERIAELSGADPQQAIISREVRAEMANQAEGQGSEEGGGEDLGVVSTAQQGLPDLRSLQGG